MNLSTQELYGSLAWLQLLHLADSALPIGSLAHSFGVETLIAECSLDVASLPAFFTEWLASSGHTEAAFCMWAHQSNDPDNWNSLNAQFSAMKPARESRDASLRLGKRFLALAARLLDVPTESIGKEVHLATAFGWIGARLHLDAALVSAAYLHSALFGAISVCQRLLPLGQTAAMQFLWDLKPNILTTVQDATQARMDDLWNLQPMLELGSMRHPQLATRLFIS